MLCKRCYQEFTNPIPEVTSPGRIHEIACAEWCAKCNALAMSIVYRDRSAYRTKILVDPLRGGCKCL